MKRSHKTHVVTDHGCAFKTRHKPAVLAGCTMDCRCGVLLFFPDFVRDSHPTVRVVRARDFHRYLYEETNGDWPLDGANSGWAEFGNADEETVVFFRAAAKDRVSKPAPRPAKTDMETTLMFRDERGNVWEEVAREQVMVNHVSKSGLHDGIAELPYTEHPVGKIYRTQDVVNVVNPISWW